MMVPSCPAGRWSLLVLLLVAATLSAALDCRKFVFAPQCRGIVAKRGGGGAAALRLRSDFSSGTGDLVPVVSDEDFQTTALDQDGGEDSNSVAEALLRAYEDLSYSDGLSGGLEEDYFLLRDTADYLSKHQKRSVRPRGLRNPATHLVNPQQQQHSRRQVAGQHQLLSPNAAFLQGLLPVSRRPNTRR